MRTRLPDFLVIGAPKCGTSALCANLAEHPDVFMASPKEPFFFSHDDRYRRGLDWYADLFAAAGPDQRLGEGSTSYSKAATHPEAAARIAEHLPDVRLIYLVRDPLEQIASHYLWHTVMWAEARADGTPMRSTFAESVREVPMLIDTARYRRQVEVHRAHVPDERILVLCFEDFRDDPDGVLRRVFGFIGVDPARHIAAAGRAVNESAGLTIDRRMTRAVRHLPGATRVVRSIPAQWRHRVAGAFKRSAPVKPAWTPELRREVLALLDDDIRGILEYAGKPPDFWPLVGTVAEDV